jgi:hypothetical protein
VRLQRLLAVLVTLVVLLGVSPSARAQLQPATAEAKRVTGRVEVLRKGQAQWLPVVVGARLAEGDDVRAFSGASAEFELPDRSTLVLAENSRILITKLDFDAQNQSRVAIFHLAVGKVIASISQVTLTLLRARQSNFSITTPTAVAAARGTNFEVAHNPAEQQTRITMLAQAQAGPPQESPSKRLETSVVECSTWREERYRRPQKAYSGQTVFVPAGGGCSAPIPNSMLAPDVFATIGTSNTPFSVPPGVLTGAFGAPPTSTQVLAVTGSGFVEPSPIAAFDQPVSQVTNPTGRDTTVTEQQAAPPAHSAASQ